MFNYGGMSSGSKLIYLKGVMILNVDFEQHEVGLYFVLVGGFPGVAPKAFLSQEVNEEIIKNNPYVLKNMEILNQYMNNWKGFHASYTLNTMYYYIYQSFMICPPIKSSITNAVNNIADTKPEDTKSNAALAETQGDGEFQKILLRSKVEEKVDKMNKIITKLAAANIMIGQNSDILSSQSEFYNTKKSVGRFFFIFLSFYQNVFKLMF